MNRKVGLEKRSKKLRKDAKINEDIDLVTRSNFNPYMYWNTCTFRDESFCVPLILYGLILNSLISVITDYIVTFRTEKLLLKLSRRKQGMLIMKLMCSESNCTGDLKNIVSKFRRMLETRTQASTSSSSARNQDTGFVSMLLIFDFFLNDTSIVFRTSLAPWRMGYITCWPPVCISGLVYNTQEEKSKAGLKQMTYIIIFLSV